jgi:hypothetical protein
MLIVLSNENVRFEGMRSKASAEREKSWRARQESLDGAPYGYASSTILASKQGAT